MHACMSAHVHMYVQVPMCACVCKFMMKAKPLKWTGLGFRDLKTSNLTVKTVADLIKFCYVMITALNITLLLNDQSYSSEGSTLTKVLLTETVLSLQYDLNLEGHF